MRMLRGFIACLIIVATSSIVHAGTSVKLEGNWLGTLKVGPVKLRMALHFTKDAKSKLSGTLDSIDQGVKGIKINAISVKGKTIQLQWKKLKAKYKGTINNDNTQIKGTFTQVGRDFKLTFKRTKKKIVVRRPQVPKKPYPYDVENVTYKNKSAKITIAGTLTLPRSKGPHPIAILISGSGPQDRDETMMGHKPFLVLADHLTRKGIAVLRYDDRGVGGTGGSWKITTMPDRASDVLAAIKYLHTRKDIDHGKLGLIGHSEGGIVGPLVASQRQDVAFVVMLAGPGISGEEILYMQSQRILTAAGAGAAEKKQQLALQKTLFRVVKRIQDPEKAKKALRDAVETWKKTLPKATRKEMEKNKTVLEASIKKVNTPWFRSFLVYDPEPVLRKVHCPVLALNGDLDVQVPGKENLSAIAKTLLKAKHKDYTVRRFPKLNHLFQTAKTGSLGEYSQIEETFAPTALNAISEWVLARVKK